MRLAAGRITAIALLYHMEMGMFREVRVEE